MEFLYYDEERFEPTCSNCGGSDFKRERVVSEVDILNLRDGIAESVDHDMHVQNEWTIECDRCGNSSDELEDLLSEIQEDEDDDDGLSDPDTYAEWRNRHYA